MYSCKYIDTFIVSLKLVFISYSIPMYSLQNVVPCACMVNVNECYKVTFPNFLLKQITLLLVTGLTNNNLLEC